jgi:hypothetical protein
LAVAKKLVEGCSERRGSWEAAAGVGVQMAAICWRGDLGAVRWYCRCGISSRELEGDHGKLKRLIRPTLGFQSMRTARATIKGLEVMRVFRKGQFRFWSEAIGARTEVSFINCIS